MNAPLDFELKTLDFDHPYLRSRGFTDKTIKDDAGENEEDEITVGFVQQARKLKADAVIFKKKSQSGMEMVPFGFGKMKYTYLYTVEIVRFDP